MKQNWYELTTDQSLAAFNSSSDGLTNAAAEIAIEKYGPNKLPEQKSDSILRIFLRQFKSPLVYILLVVSFIVAYLGDFKDSAVIGFVLLLNAVIGTVQEGRAQNTLAALKRFVQTTALVRRGGVEELIPDLELVPGDIVIIREGDKIPADARVLNSYGLTIDEASLTGESEPVIKTNEFLQRGPGEPEFSPTQQRNMIFKGTSAVAGRGEVLVVATGVATEIGKISQTLAEGETEIPLQKNIRDLSRLIMVSVFVICLILLIGGLLMGKPLLEMIKTVVSMAVSLIPEGLPVVMTLVLANGVWRMSQRKALVKKLAAVEALGQTDVIAVDKTGTITKNELVVENVVIQGKNFTVKGTGYEPKGDILIGNNPVSPLDIPELVLAGKIAAFASAELLFNPEKHDWQVSGDPTEGALLVLAQKIGFRPEDMQQRHPVIQEIPFDYKVKYHAVVYKDYTSNGAEIHNLAVVGAPESIAKLAGIPEMQMHDRVVSLVKDGLRVVAFGFAQVPGIVDPENLPRLTFGGLFGMRDSLHPEVPAAVEAVHAGGIRIIMITGDHKITAEAIAKQAGIFKPGDLVITGDQLELMTEGDLSEKLKTVSVFARVTPIHKLRIVRALKSNGSVVAMTGDGVNDVPPLIAADLGVAMGISGTEVTKEAADIVLLDDNFATIAAAVEEGRGIYRTIGRSLLYLFSTSMAELFTIAIGLFAGWPLPLIAVQVLWLNFVTDGFLTVTFAMEPADVHLLKNGKMKTTKYMLSKDSFGRMLIMGVVMTVSTLTAFYYYKDGDYSKATTVALTVLAVMQWINAWNCRSEKTSAFRNIFTNPYLIIATLIIIILQLLAIYLPVLQGFLKTAPLETSDWIVVLAFSLPLLLIEELRKFISRKKA